MAKDKGLEYYPTPAWVTQGLLNKEKFCGFVWEPACGKGEMSDVISANGYHTYASDITSGSNFLTCEPPNGVGFFDIITNPPFSKALEFAKRGLEVTNRKVALLLRLAFLESQSRKEFFETAPLKTVYVMSKRVTMYPDGIITAGSGTMAMAWFVWDKQYDGKPMLDWI